MSEVQNNNLLNLNEGQDNEQMGVQEKAMEGTSAMTSRKACTRTANPSLAGTEIKGHLFEYKLLTLFMVRAISAGYQFELAANNENIGGKFDDLIFRYKVQDDSPEGKHWCYRFLQAKHKVDRTAMKITASHLLSASANDKVTDYSLLKYFNSYCKIKARGDDVHDCIICTTIDFDYDNMDGILLKPIDSNQEEILKFQVNNIGSSNEKSPTLYKLELPESQRKKLLESDDIRILAKQLSICATKSHSPNQDVFQTYHVALVKENVIDLGSASTKSKTMKLHQHFIDGVETLSPGARDLRQMLSNLNHEQDLAKWKFQRPGFFDRIADAQKSKTKLPHCITDDDVKDFCDKLVFVVNSPSEDKLDAIIRADINKYYDQDDNESQLLRVLNEILNWFKSVKKEESEWLSSKIGNEILLKRINQESIIYRNELVKELKFKQNVIGNLTTKLNLLVDSGKVIRISTLSPRWTTAKFISAIETWPDHEKNGEVNYWVTSTNCLLDENKIELWKNRHKIKATKNIRHFFLVVDEDNLVSSHHQTIVKLTSHSLASKNTVIIIGHEGDVQDEIQFDDLNEESQTAILSKTISFQGSDATLRDLIDTSETNLIMDWPSIRELMDKKPIAIPSFGTSDFEKSLYIPRKFTCSFYQHLLDDTAQEIGCNIDTLQREFSVNSKGKFRWFVNNKRKKEIWEKIKVILQRNQLADKPVIFENELLNGINHKVIITGVAGTGKSYVLSHYCNELKKKNPNYWIINISLADHIGDLMKLDDVDPKIAIDFIVNLSAVGANQSSFAQSLLKNRLQAGNRIVLMLDGFDEIDSESQDKVIKLINSLNENVSLFVTTRFHMADKLEFELSQLSYSLVKFEKEDQINYMTSIWRKNLRSETTNSGDELILHFATKLINQVSETLNDQEMDFVGIPLQCRILAECFQSKVQAAIQNCTSDFKSDISQSFLSLLEDGNSFNLASLYKLLIDTKREEKFKIQKDNYLANCFAAIANKQLKCHLTKLAIKTIIQHEKDINVLWSDDPRYQSENDQEENDDILNKLGVDLGLLLDQNKEDNKAMRKHGSQFLHRTYAEYLIADYVYRGFLLNEKDNNKLLGNESVRHLITGKILINEEYDGIQVFLNSMLNEWDMDYANKKQQFSAGDFPKHLQDFASLIIEKQDSLLYLTGRRQDFNFALVIGRENLNIFKFVLNCLDETFTRSKVRSVITKILIQDFVSHIILQLDNNLFQRLLAYYDDASDDDWKEMVFNLCNGKYFDEPKLNWNRELPQENIKFFLAFLRKHHKRLKRLPKERDENNQKAISNMIKFLIQNSNSSLAVNFYNILLPIYSNEPELLLELMKSGIFLYYLRYTFPFPFWPGKKGNILETLKFLQTSGLYKAIQQTSEISCLVLRNEPETFQHFYKIHRPLAKTEFRPNSVDPMTAIDLFGMTCMHQAVLYGDIATVEHILYNSPQILTFKSLYPDVLLSFIGTNKFEGSELFDLMENASCPRNVCLSPLYIAFSCCDLELCQVMLKFLKITLPADELRDIYTNKNECLLSFTNEAIYYRKEQMFQTILKSVKSIMDYDGLANLLKSSGPWPNEDFKCDFPGLFSSSNYWIFKIVAEIFVQDDEIGGYEKLNEFIFSDSYFRQLAFKYGEANTLQKLIATKGFDNWIKFLLDKNIEEAMMLFSSKHFLIEIGEIQRLQLLDIITTTTKQEKPKSYWAEFIVRAPIWAINFMKSVTEIFNEKEKIVKKLLSFEQEEVVLIRTVLFNDIEDFDTLLACFSKEIQHEFCLHTICAAKDTVQLWDENLEKYHKWKPYNPLKFFRFYLNYGSKDEMAQFIHVVTAPRSVIEEKECSFLDALLCWPFSILDIKKLMEHVSVKLGEDAVKNLILQENDCGNLTLRPAFNKHLFDIEKYYSHLSKETRDTIRHHVLTTPSVISFMKRQSLESWAYHYLKSSSIGSSLSLNLTILDGFNVLVTYFLIEFDAQQLQNFIKYITSIESFNNTTHYSIWKDYIDQACQSIDKPLLESEKSIRKLMKSIVANLREFPMETITHHKNSDNSYAVIHHTASCGKIELLEALISQFNNAKQQEIRRNLLCRMMVIENVWKTNGPKNLIRFYLLENDGDLQEGQIRAKIIAGFNALTENFFEELNGNQLSGLMQLILSVNSLNSANECSLWGNYIEKLFLSAHSNPTERDLKVIIKLLHCVERRLGKENVSILLQHENANGVIHRITASNISRPTQIINEMLEYLSDKDQIEIQPLIP